MQRRSSTLNSELEMDSISCKRKALTEADKQLIEQFHAAFASAPKQLAGSVVTCYCQGCTDFGDRLKPFDARNVPDTVLLSDQDAIAILSPVAFRYYLPRHLEFTIVHRNSSDFLVENVLYALSPDEPESPKFLEKLAAFSTEERTAVADYIATRRRSLPDSKNDFFDSIFDRAQEIWGVSGVGS